MPDAAEHPEHDPQAMACAVPSAALCSMIVADRARCRMIADDADMIGADGALSGKNFALYGSFRTVFWGFWSQRAVRKPHRLTWGVG